MNLYWQKTVLWILLGLNALYDYLNILLIGYMLQVEEGNEEELYIKLYCMMPAGAFFNLELTLL